MALASSLLRSLLLAAQLIAAGRRTAAKFLSYLWATREINSAATIRQALDIFIRQRRSSNTRRRHYRLRASRLRYAALF